MVCIGDNGRGFTISEQTTNTTVLTLNSAIVSSPGVYVLYATLPDIATPGIAVINTNTVAEYSNYVGSLTDPVYVGDNSGQRAIAVFRVRNVAATGKDQIDSTSIQTISSYDYQEIWRHLNEIGLYTKNDSANIGDSAYAGQNVISDVNIVATPANAGTYNNKLAYYDGSAYSLALANDTNSENVVGILRTDIGYNAVDSSTSKGRHSVITSGVVYLGNDLDSTIYPNGTTLYLSDTAAGEIVRDVDEWSNQGAAYNLGDLVVVTGTGAVEYILKLETASGLTPVALVSPSTTLSAVWQDGDTLSTANSVEDTQAGGTVDRWVVVAKYNPRLFNYSKKTTGGKIRIGLSLGNGMMLLQTGGGSVGANDDHNESANAHQDIQDALEKGGNYVWNIPQGKTSMEYRGQYYDEKAQFDTTVGEFDTDVLTAGAEVYTQHLVYRNTDGKYYRAVIDDTNTTTQKKKYVVGISSRVGLDAANTGFVIGSGYVQYDTTTIDTTGGPGLAEGVEIFLTDDYATPANHGGLTTKRTKVKAGYIVKPGNRLSTTALETRGLIYFQPELDYRNELEKYGIFVDSGVSLTDKGQTTRIDVTFAAAGYTVGTPVYITGNNTYTKAIDDGGNTDAENWIGVVTELNTPDSTGTIATAGFVDLGSAHGVAAGSPVYLGTAAGTVSSTGRVLIGIAVDTQVVYLMKGAANVNVSADAKNDQLFLSNATFTGVADNTHRVVRSTSTGFAVATYDGSNPNVTIPDGISYQVNTNAGIVVNKGYLAIDTTAGGDLFTATPSVGDVLYLDGLGTVTGFANDSAFTLLPKGQLKIGKVINSNLIYINIEKDTFTKNEVTNKAIEMAIALS